MTSNILRVPRDPAVDAANYDLIARELLTQVLHVISWDTCKVEEHHGNRTDTGTRFVEEVEKAAARLKEAGIGWCEWT